MGRRGMEADKGSKRTGNVGGGRASLVVGVRRNLSRSDHLTRADQERRRSRGKPRAVSR